MNRSRPTVTAVIPTFNRAHLVVQAVESVLSQTRPPDHVVVVDDGSSDDTTNILEVYGGRIHYRWQPNAGKPFALNAAIADAKSDYLWIFDDDDVALPDALERHLAVLAGNPDADFTYSGCYLFDGDKPPAQPDSERLYDALGAPPETLFIRWLETFPGHTGGMLVPLDCYRAVGPFDTRLTFGEDYEMMLRIARRFRGVKLAEPTFLMRQHAGYRGPAHERRAVCQREAAWRVYERETFLRLRDELDLYEYLSAGLSLGPETRPRALLQRACVMARHGLFQEALHDLSAAMAGRTDGPPLEEERKIVSRMLDLEPALLRGRGGWLAAVGRLLAAEAPPLLDAGAAGLWWSAQREWSRRSYSGTIQPLWSLWRLAGLRTGCRMAKRAWNKSIKSRESRGHERNEPKDDRRGRHSHL